MSSGNLRIVLTPQCFNKRPLVYYGRYHLLGDAKETQLHANTGLRSAASTYPETVRSMHAGDRYTMSFISPWFRGYRLALRDVQRTIELYAHAIPARNSDALALFMTADKIGIELCHLKIAQSTIRKQVQAKENQQMGDECSGSGLIEISDNILFDTGYRSGFDRTLTIVSAYGLKMNDPNARDAISEVARLLKRYKLKIAVCESQRIQTLRARKYLLPFGEC